MSDDNLITPEKWGPKIWHSLHYISLGYPENPTDDQKQKYKAFFLLLKDVLPCSICANHYAENLKKVPLTDEVMTNKEKLVKWVIDLHNTVNEMKEKPIIPHDQARRMIEMNATCAHPIKQNVVEKFANIIEPKTNSSNNIAYILVGILVCLVAIAVIYKKN